MLKTAREVWWVMDGDNGVTGALWDGERWVRDRRALYRASDSDIEQLELIGAQFTVIGCLVAA